MNRYEFKTDQFGFNSEGFHLLRSGYCYQTLTSNEIQKIEIKRGIRVKNRTGLLIFGLICLALGIGCLMFISPLDSLDGFFIKGAQMVWGAIMIIFIFWSIAAISIYQALIKSIVLKITAKGHWFVFSLYPLKKSNQLDNFIQYLKNSSFKKLLFVDRKVLH